MNEFKFWERFIMIYCLALIAGAFIMKLVGCV